MKRKRITKALKENQAIEILKMLNLLSIIREKEVTGQMKKMQSSSKELSCLLKNKNSYLILALTVTREAFHHASKTKC